jgi:hypothetical protein
VIKVGYELCLPQHGADLRSMGRTITGHAFGNCETLLYVQDAFFYLLPSPGIQAGLTMFRRHSGQRLFPAIRTAGWHNAIRHGALRRGHGGVHDVRTRQHVILGMRPRLACDRQRNQHRAAVNPIVRFIVRNTG